MATCWMEVADMSYDGYRFVDGGLQLLLPAGHLLPLGTVGSAASVLLVDGAGLVAAESHVGGREGVGRVAGTRAQS